MKVVSLPAGDRGKVRLFARSPMHASTSGAETRFGVSSKSTLDQRAVGLQLDHHLHRPLGAGVLAGPQIEAAAEAVAPAADEIGERLQPIGRSRVLRGLGVVERDAAGGRVVRDVADELLAVRGGLRAAGFALARLRDHGRAGRHGRGRDRRGIGRRGRLRWRSAARARGEAQRRRGEEAEEDGLGGGAGTHVSHGNRLRPPGRRWGAGALARASPLGLGSARCRGPASSSPSFLPR